MRIFKKWRILYGTVTGKLTDTNINVTIPFFTVFFIAKGLKEDNYADASAAEELQQLCYNNLGKTLPIFYHND
jgi:hypothetical protein